MGKFLPGQSGNPGGRPKGPALSTQLRQDLERPVIQKAIDVLRRLGVDVSEDMTNREALSQIMITRALAGDARMIGVILDRTEGKAAGKLEVTGKVDGKIMHEHRATATMELLAARVQSLRDKALNVPPATVDAEVVEVKDVQPS